MTDYRCCFALRGNAKFLSHLDLLSIWQRAMRRAKMPVVYSQGFNPHSLLAFGPAHPVGIAEEAAYFDLTLTKPMAPEKIVNDLQAVLPEGMVLHSVRELVPRTPALTASINLAAYTVRLRAEDCSDLPERIEKLQQLDVCMVDRKTPKGVKTFDLRPSLGLLTYRGGGLLDMEIGLGSGIQPRPQEVLAALGLAERSVTEIVRTGLFIINAQGERALP